MRSISALRRRVKALGKQGHLSLSYFKLQDGFVRTIRQRELLDACLDTLYDRPSERAHILLNATSARDGRLHELVQAIRGKGPNVNHKRELSRVRPSHTRTRKQHGKAVRQSK